MSQEMPLPPGAEGFVATPSEGPRVVESGHELAGLANDMLTKMMDLASNSRFQVATTIDQVKRRNIQTVALVPAAPFTGVRADAGKVAAYGVLTETNRGADFHGRMFSDSFGESNIESTADVQATLLFSSAPTELPIPLIDIKGQQTAGREYQAHSIVTSSVGKDRRDTVEEQVEALQCGILVIEGLKKYYEEEDTETRTLVDKDGKGVSGIIYHDLDKPDQEYIIPTQ